ncbi:MAG TPA: GMC family oxidoreductase [Solirubrobacterales bacterium]|nr:GMC family oxidoreductase [Solirubrobacterales bacterium]
MSAGAAEAQASAIAVENPATGETIAGRRAARLHSRGRREIVGSGLRAPDWARGEDLDAFVAALNGLEIVPREYVTFSAHQMGTCRLGRDPASSVANPWGELHDTPGVWVGDASAFPSASGTNPMATIMALARRTAHAIAAG